MSLMLRRLRPLATVLVRNGAKLPKQQPLSRNAGTILYRGHLIKEPAWVHYTGEAISFFMWYWILYHCYYEFEHLAPPHHFPDTTKYTDEELGIPPDDE